jgi:hypothetical protein
MRGLLVFESSYGLTFCVFFRMAFRLHFAYLSRRLTWQTLRSFVEPLECSGRVKGEARARSVCNVLTMTEGEPSAFSRFHGPAIPKKPLHQEPFEARYRRRCFLDVLGFLESAFDQASLLIDLLDGLDFTPRGYRCNCRHLFPFG